MCNVFVFLTETPLSLAVQCEPSGGEAIRVLVEGGAHIDFRSKDGLTPVHKAVRGHRHTALLVNIHVSYKHPNRAQRFQEIQMYRTCFRIRWICSGIESDAALSDVSVTA